MHFPSKSSPLQYIKNLVPLGISFVFILVSCMPWPFDLLRLACPTFVVMSLFYWMLYRPDLLPMIVAFGIGLIQDLLSGAPMGLSSLLYVLMHFLLQIYRRYIAEKPFLVLWTGFIFSFTILNIARYGLSMLYHLQFLTPLPFLTEILLAALLFPLISSFLIYLHRHFLNIA